MTPSLSLAAFSTAGSEDVNGAGDKTSGTMVAVISIGQMHDLACLAAEIEVMCMKCAKS